MGRRMAAARWAGHTAASGPRSKNPPGSVRLKYETCEFCDGLYVRRAAGRVLVPCCRRPECRRAKQTARMVAYYREHPEKKAANQRLYRERHPGKFGVWDDASKAAYARRRARKKTGHDGERIVLREVFERDGWCCGICSEPVDQALAYPDPMSSSLDHVVPLSRGGLHVLTNVQLAHLSCNVRKGDRLAA